MPKMADEPLIAINLRLFERDLTQLRQLYSQSPGVSMAIRAIIRSFLHQVEATSTAKIDATTAPKLNLPLNLLDLGNLQ